MSETVLHSEWFITGFLDIAEKVANDELSPTQALAEVHDRIARRLSSRARSRGIRLSADVRDEVMQQFWLRMLSGRVIERHDPSRAGPWPMIDLNLIGALSDELRRTKQMHSLNSASDAQLEDECANHNGGLESADDCRRIAAILNDMPETWRGAVLGPHAILLRYGAKQAAAGNNAAVDRWRAIRALRLAM